MRRAVNYAIDPAALERIYAGTMRPLQQVLPTAMPGHRTFHSLPARHGQGAELIAAADPQPNARSRSWTNDYGPNKQAGEYYEGVLREIGFEPTLKVVPAANYTTIIGNGSTPNLDTGWGNWYIDYPHPNDYFEPQLSGASIARPRTATTRASTTRRSTSEIAEARPRTARAEAGSRLRAARPRGDAAGALGAVRLGHPDHLRLERIDLSKLVVSPVYGQDLASFAPN